MSELSSLTPQRSEPGGAVDATAAGVLAEQVRYLYRGSVVGAANLVNAFIVAFILSDDVPPALVRLWVAGTAVVVVGRLLLARGYRRSASSGHDAELWARRFTIGAIASGILWGTLPLILIHHGSYADHVFASFVIAGMTAGGLGSLAACYRAYLGYLLTALAPLGAMFFAHWDARYAGMGTMVVLYAGVMSLTARNFNASIVSTLRLKVENTALNRNLTAAQDGLAKANEGKWETLAHLSHELRTPMNAVLGFSEVLKGQMFGPLGNRRYVDYTDHIHNSGQHALDLINEILDLSQAEAGKLDLCVAEANAGRCADECVRMLSGKAAEKNIAIAITASADETTLLADPIKLRQILLNLLSNAVKFTPEGGKVAVSARRDDKGRVVLMVTDTGVGMSDAEIPRAFTPFVRLDNPLTRQNEGTGLGLPLCKRLVELHGGSLLVESAPGQGTTCIVTFPPERTLPAADQTGNSGDLEREAHAA